MNKVSLIGNIVNDLELKDYKNGDKEGKYVRFTLAINEYNIKKNERIATFIEVVAFDKKAIILTTKGTGESKRFKELFKNYKTKNCVLVEAPLLASLIENNKDTYSYLNDLLKNYKGYEVVVLGCTHFPLAKNAITKVLGNVTFVDGSHGIKNRVYDLIKDKLNKKGGKINIISTKDDVSKIILDIVKGNK